MRGPAACQRTERDSHLTPANYNRVPVCPADRIGLLTSLLLTSISLVISFR
jgi:hypothetical protein